MFAYLKGRSYDIVRMLLYQIAIAIFGISLAFATTSRDTSTLQIVTGVFSVIFYLFLIAYLLWDMGIKDLGRFTRGEEGISRLTGLYMGLVAGLPNFLIAILVTLGTFLADIPFFGKMGGVAATVGLLIEGMYMGLLSLRVGDVPLNSLWFMWFLIALPMPLTATLAYYAGSKDFHLFKPKPPKM